jgi:hypothetical protein
VEGVEPLVAERGGDALGAQQGGQGVGLGEADAGAPREDVKGAPGHARIAGILGVRDGVADELEGGLGVYVCVGGLGAQQCRGGPDQRVIVVNGLAHRQKGREFRGFLDQLHVPGA